MLYNVKIEFDFETGTKSKFTEEFLNKNFYGFLEALTEELNSNETLIVTSTTIEEELS